MIRSEFLFLVSIKGKMGSGGNELILYSIIVMGSIGLLAGVLLFVVARKFYVKEDPRIALIREILPGANCGGCGYPGCNAFAEAIAKSEDMGDFFCPVAGSEPMKQIASLMGVVSPEKAAYVAVVRCNCSPFIDDEKIKMDGLSDCFIAAMNVSSECGCPHACLGLGDCVRACPFDAIHINPFTKLPVVIDEKCNACASCVRECPRKIIELRRQQEDGNRVFVSCVNVQKGIFSKQNCTTTCIACNKCVKACKHDAVAVKDNLAYIKDINCISCMQCVAECPNNTIHAVFGNSGKRMNVEEIQKAKVE
ncbi:MAG: RnfABCDGE type electron transport complex subunit B [Bacteroidota bacterium]